MRGPDVGTMLVRALVSNARVAGCEIELVDATWTPWASATFGGARHTIAMRSAEEGFADWVAALPDTEFALHGHLVADITVDSVRREGGHRIATIAALTLIED